MATSSFEKDFIVTDKQAPLWEKAFKELENKKFDWKPIPAQEIPSDEIIDFLKGDKS